ncbi:hypothetical protein VNI00_007261 [Paramarasmius palmivorus]|uniref:Uncharacterized protein n=1 Tax=Paramarasmius palmivorus TaxID=297713 RepID=A0AAW0D2H5_9AGAR
MRSTPTVKRSLDPEGHGTPEPETGEESEAVHGTEQQLAMRLPPIANIKPKPKPLRQRIVPPPTVATSKLAKIRDNVNNFFDELGDIARELKDVQEELVRKDKKIEKLEVENDGLEQRVILFEKREQVIRFLQSSECDLRVLERFLEVIKEIQEV